MYVQGPLEYETGYTEISKLDSDMLMEFGILKLKEGGRFADDLKLEKAYLLIKGSVRFLFEGQERAVKRSSCFDEGLVALHVSKGVKIEIEALADTEIAVMRTENDRDFPSRLYSGEDVKDEYRGAGTMLETSTRIVRTAFDYSNAPDANLVLGEVISFPGKWSSYPPHHHPQPEIYFYKTDKPEGYGHAECGENVYKARTNGTLFIREGEVHPHCSAPGYALWYIWVIRHLDGNPYITPIFVDEHLWLTKPEAEIWGKNQ